MIWYLPVVDGNGDG